MKPIIRVVDVWKQYSEDEQGSVALRGVNMEIYPGDIVVLFGKSGSGKTTLLNLLAGLDAPTKGCIEVDEKDLAGMGEKGRTLLRRNRIGFVFQFFNLLPTLTAFENVFLSLELAGRPDPEKVREALRAVNLEGKERRFPYELSGGEQQRVAIARALVKRPDIILADEPTGNLDTATGTQILDLLVGQCRISGTTLVMVTHAQHTCHYARRVLRMVDGALTEEQTLKGPAL